MASASAFPSSVAGSPYGDGTWTDISNVTASDNTYATVALDAFEGPSESEYIVSTGFGFAVPAGATINGIVVEVEGKGSAASLGRTVAAQLLKAGVAVGSDYGLTEAPWGTTEAFRTVGGGAADLWGTTWTRAEVNDAGFGVQFAIGANGDAGTVSVDSVRVTVYYTEAGGSVAPLVVHHRKQQGAA